jgi:hypothetical protein
MQNVHGGARTADSSTLQNHSLHNGYTTTPKANPAAATLETRLRTVHEHAQQLAQTELNIHQHRGLSIHEVPRQVCHQTAESRAFCRTLLLNPIPTRQQRNTRSALALPLSRVRTRCFATDSLHLESHEALLHAPPPTHTHHHPVSTPPPAPTHYLSAAAQLQRHVLVKHSQQCGQAGWASDYVSTVHKQTGDTAA